MTGNNRWPEILPFTPHDHDVRLERNGSVYYIRGVKRYEPFRGDATWDGTLGGLVMLLATVIAAHLLWRSQDTWKVGVLHYQPSRLGGRIRLIHKERLPRGEQPDPRIQQLVEGVQRGDYDAD